jgi:hypothetical protein
MSGESVAGRTRRRDGSPQDGGDNAKCVPRRRFKKILSYPNGENTTVPGAAEGFSQPGANTRHDFRDSKPSPPPARQGGPAANVWVFFHQPGKIWLALFPRICHDSACGAEHGRD